MATVIKIWELASIGQVFGFGTPKSEQSTLY